jgi:hypothetical protein
MPTLPSAYSVVLEINRVKSKETKTVREYFDFDQKRIRTDIHDDAKMMIVIQNWASKTRYAMINDLSQASFFHEMNLAENSLCVKEDLDTSPSRNAFAAKTRHMKSPHEVFMFDSDGDEQYVGEDYARGIKCTQWYAQGTETEEIGGHTITTTAKRNHWFSTKDWSDAGCMTGDGRDCFLELPVRTVSEGTVYNHTSKQTTKFHDHYEYTAFVAGKPDEKVLSPESSGGLTCSVAAEGTTSTEVATKRDTSAGGVTTIIEAARGHTGGADAAPAIPALPTAYTSLVEVSKVDSKETYTVCEYLDFNFQRLRTDVVDGGKRVSVVRDFSALQRHTVTDGDVYDDPYDGFAADDGCTTAPIAGDQFVAAATRHLKSPHEVFMFSPEAKHSYVGVDYARGIECDRWYAQGTETEEIGGHTITTTAKRNHWFSTKEWSDANCVVGDATWGKCATQYPVRIVSEGTVYNHTSKQTTKFHDHYEYMSFIVGKPPTYMFDVSTVCPGAKAPADDTATEAPPSYGSKGSTSGGESGNLRTSSDGSKTATDLATGGGKSDESTGTKVGLAVGVAFSILVGLVAVAAAVRKRGRDRGSGKGRRNSSAPLFGGRRFSGGGATELIDEDVPDFGNVTSSSAGSSSSSSKGRSRRGLSIRSNQAISMPVVQSGILQAVVGSAQIVDDPNLGSSSSSDSSSFRSHDLPCAV